MRDPRHIPQPRGSRGGWVHGRATQDGQNHGTRWRMDEGESSGRKKNLLRLGEALRGAEQVWNQQRQNQQALDSRRGGNRAVRELRPRLGRQAENEGSQGRLQRNPRDVQLRNDH